VPIERSDGELLRAAQAGNQVAWADLVRRITPRLFGVARALGLNRTDAADVCQVAWLRLWNHIGEIRDIERVRGWLATTVRNECFRHMRSAGRHVPVEADEHKFEPDPAGQPEVDADLLRTEREVSLWRAFSLLPVHCRRLLRLLMVDPPPTYEEVADDLDMPVGSIGPTRGRCLKMLRNRLGGITGDSGGSPS
jgi:RNA polymerase sigma factor (sigma-70 family)